MSFRTGELRRPRSDDPAAGGTIDEIAPVAVGQEGTRMTTPHTITPGTATPGTVTFDLAGRCGQRGTEIDDVLTATHAAEYGETISLLPLAVISSGADEHEAEWHDRALCAQTDPEAFFPEKGGSTREAKKICTGCEVRSECLTYALAHDERFGIWGGMSERERRRLKRRAV